MRGFTRAEVVSRHRSAAWHESPGIVIQRSLAARGATRGQPRRMFISGDQRLNDVDEVLHPLFEAASGLVGRIEDVGQVLEPAGGGDQDGRERGDVES